MATIPNLTHHPVLPSHMRALVLTDAGPVVRTDVPVPKPGRDEALIQVHLAGVCATDLQLVRGYKGGFRGVLGHEFVGTVAAAPGHEEWLGRRVVGEINAGCGECALCKEGLANHCPTRRALGITTWNGAFADYLSMPVANLYHVPPALPDEQAVFTEPLAAALRILEQVHVGPDSRVYVLGDGRLGNLTAQALARTGCDLTVIGRHPEKLALLQRLGIATAVAANPADMTGLLAQPAHVVVDATGTPGGIETALSLVRPTGTVVLKTTVSEPLERFDLSQLAVDEVCILGSRCGPFAPALRLLAAGAIITAPLIHARFGLDDGVAALEQAGQRGVLKVLIEMEQG